MNQQVLDFKFKKKWLRDLALDIPEQQWKQIFNACFKTVKDNFLIWFQYRIIHRILGTNKLLFEMNLKDSPLCSICQDQTETLMHLFVTCSKVSQIWSDLEDWILKLTKFKINFSVQDKLLGRIHFDPFFLPINTIIIVTKYYIFTSSKTNRLPNIFEMQKRLKIVYDDQLLVAQVNSKQTDFNNKWAQFKTLFNNV